jgi:hypothetical protein
MLGHEALGMDRGRLGGARPRLLRVLLIQVG